MNSFSIGLEITFTLNADGAAVESMPSEEDDAGSWLREGDKVIVDINDEPMEFTLTDNMLFIRAMEEVPCMLISDKI